MILEADRIVATWLADVTHGINALLASTPLDGSDVRPTNLLTVSDETNNEDAARSQLPAATGLPVCFVETDSITDLDGQVVTVTRDGKLKLRIRIALSNPNTAAGRRDMSYYMRTAMRSLRKLFDADPSLRTRNSIYLETCDSMAEAIVGPTDQTESAIVNGYIIPTIQLRDLAP